MKLKWNDSDDYVKKLAKEVAAVLIYGPNRGQVNNRAESMTQAVLGDAVGDPFRHFSIDNDALQETPQMLLEEASTPAFGGASKFIRIKNPDKKFAEIAAELLQNPPPDCFLLVTCEELPPADPWRKLFESADNAGICACYMADNIAEIIGAKLRAENITIDREALQLLAGQLQGRDNGIINMETQKLILYAGDNKTIGLEDVRELCGSGGDVDMDSLIIACLAGQSLDKLDSGLDGLYKRGANDVAIIRTLMRNLRRLAELKRKMAEGADFKSAAKSLRPPLFFKLENDFRRASNLWNNDAIYTLILQAQSTELNSKSGYGFEPLIVARTLQKITARAINSASRSARR